MEAVTELIKDDHFVADEREIFNFVWRWGRHHQKEDEHLHQTIGPLMPLLCWNLMDSAHFKRPHSLLAWNDYQKFLPYCLAGVLHWMQAQCSGCKRLTRQQPRVTFLRGQLE